MLRPPAVCALSSVAIFVSFSASQELAAKFGTMADWSHHWENGAEKNGGGLPRRGGGYGKEQIFNCPNYIAYKDAGFKGKWPAPEENQRLDRSGPMAGKKICSPCSTQGTCSTHAPTGTSQGDRCEPPTRACTQTSAHRLLKLGTPIRRAHANMHA